MEKGTWCVYAHISPSGKRYIGIAKDVKHRWRNNGTGYRGSTRIFHAIKKYGWHNFQHEILFKDLNRVEAMAKEKELIAMYKTMDVKYGYNLTSGGECCIASKETKCKISKSLMGHAVSKSLREKLSALRSIAVICKDTGEIFPSIKQAAMAYGISGNSITNVCRGVQITAGGLKWMYECKSLSDKYKAKEYVGVSGKRIMCVQTNKTYNTISEAARDMNISRRSLSYAIEGRHKQSGGYTWVQI